MSLFSHQGILDIQECVWNTYEKWEMDADVEKMMQLRWMKWNLQRSSMKLNLIMEAIKICDGNNLRGLKWDLQWEKHGNGKTYCRGQLPENFRCKYCISIVDFVKPPAYFEHFEHVCEHLWKKLGWMYPECWKIAEIV